MSAPVTFELNTELRKILAESGWFDPATGDDEDLRDQGLDSLGLALLVGNVERAFGIRIALDDLSVDSWSTVARIRRVITQAQEKSGK